MPDEDTIESYLLELPEGHPYVKVFGCTTEAVDCRNDVAVLLDPDLWQTDLDGSGHAFCLDHMPGEEWPVKKASMEWRFHFDVA
jgi:hypothetical protein